MTDDILPAPGGKLIDGGFIELHGSLSVLVVFR